MNITLTLEEYTDLMVRAASQAAIQGYGWEREGESPDADPTEKINDLNRQLFKEQEKSWRYRGVLSWARTAITRLVPMKEDGPKVPGPVKEIFDEISHALARGDKDGGYYGGGEDDDKKSMYNIKNEFDMGTTEGEGLNGAKIATLQRGHAEWKESALKLQSELMTANERIDSLETGMQTKTGVIRELNTRVADRVMDIAQLQLDIQCKDARIAKLKADLDEANEAIDLLTDDRDRMYVTNHKLREEYSPLRKTAALKDKKLAIFGNMALRVKGELAGFRPESIKDFKAKNEIAAGIQTDINKIMEIDRVAARGEDITADPSPTPAGDDTTEEIDEYYIISCSCGRKISVGCDNAGGEAKCVCGRRHKLQ